MKVPAGLVSSVVERTLECSDGGDIVELLRSFVYLRPLERDTLLRVTRRAQGPNSIEKFLLERQTHIMLGQAATFVRDFVKCFPRVPQLLCGFPATQVNKGNYQEIVYKTSYPSSSTSSYLIFLNIGDIKLKCQNSSQFSSQNSSSKFFY